MVFLLWETTFVRPRPNLSLQTRKDRQQNFLDVVQQSYSDNLKTRSKGIFDLEASFPKHPLSVRHLSSKDDMFKTHINSEGKKQVLKFSF